MFKAIPIATTAAAALLLAAPSFAQTTPSAPRPAVQAPATPAVADARRFIGRSVRNAQNETVGEVKSIVLDKAGAVEGVVLAVGGFLGVAQRDVMVPWRELTVSDGGETVRIDMSKERVGAMAPYRYPDESYRGAVFGPSGVWRPADAPPTNAQNRSASSLPPGGSRADNPTVPTTVAPGSVSPPPPNAESPIASRDFNADGHISASALVGTTIRDGDKDAIGEVEDVYLDTQGAPRAVIVRVGGVLGFGSRRVALDWADLQFGREGSSLLLTTTLTKETIRSKPLFEGRARH